MPITLTARTEADTVRLGGLLASLLRKPGDLVLLEGDLGAGKTTLARAIIRGLAGAPIDVPSPTFALIEAYDFETPLYHVDLYRLDDADQGVELGLEDMMDAGIMLVEWPERAAHLFRGRRLVISLTALEDGTRMISLAPNGAAWSERIDALQAEFSA